MLRTIRPSLVTIGLRAAQHHAFTQTAIRALTIPAITKRNTPSTEPIHANYRGDWVLFHPVYSPSELKAVEVLHRKPASWSDKVAQGLVRTARKIFDLASGYKHVEGPPPAGLDVAQLRQRGYLLSEKQWLTVRHSIFGWSGI